MGFRDVIRDLFAPDLPPAPVPTLKSGAIKGREQLGTITARVDDSEGWTGFTSRPHDYNPGQVQEIYQDALTAWRKNPIAWRIIAINTDYVVGPGLHISSQVERLDKFIRSFWNHPKNRMDLRLESMCDELARSGDLFVLLFRNSQDGMSYIRFVTKDMIERIITAPNDWETELSFTERLPDGSTRVWMSPENPGAGAQDAVMMHYSVNRPVGALLGESDLTTMLPWLLRYSRMLEDRVRLNWAVRAFLWVVTVPANKVKEKQEQYRGSPEAGSIIVKDDSETWAVQAPSLNASDAASDLKAIRQMIDAGSGFPPHWRGEAADANLATATAMQAPTERHLSRRQQYFAYVLEDILYHAYQRAVEIGRARPLTTNDYTRLFVAVLPDVTNLHNEVAAIASKDITTSLKNLRDLLPGLTPSLQREAVRMAFQFAGEALDEDELNRVMREIADCGLPSTNKTADGADNADGKNEYTNKSGEGEGMKDEGGGMKDE
jgi:hypothetical protein